MSASGIVEVILQNGLRSRSMALGRDADPLTKKDAIENLTRFLHTLSRHGVAVENRSIFSKN